MKKMIIPTVPECIATRNYGLLSRFSRQVMMRCGWTIIGELPQQPKFILAVAPHTSNWDFFVGIGVMFTLNLKVRFLAKGSLFRWPIKSLLNGIGGIGVDRNHSHGVVGQIVDEFNSNEKFILGIAPEGTRSKTVEWRTGFLHIAKQANVPVVPVSFDFFKKEVKFHHAVIITGDINQELVEFKQVFANVCAKKPQAV
ncbi:1-acyl-sn-glycerol-3-phosphate acyltransferase [Colwellia sp. Arc7-D]|jgi:1-acyl-sn-glycerol-3-phosphate acyltransferase|uniref:1-acyl-sn-glycerol-3-phosphate acyltransferase n=1 Tax=Colwellia sp. Arc7-D TaxID=2161872 RepID=UPI001EF37A12|nr:1-acyl-sn-glycerol-3-phosphate acyltransferase [Colwellia sp. Arc7-D]